jgi:multicomponent Na+:H+ antiporter subunit E
MTKVYTFGLLMAFWILLSGRFDGFHLGLGILSSLGVTIMSHDLLFEDGGKRNRVGEVWRFLLYLPWLFKEIVLATIHVALLALDRRMIRRIDPQLVEFKTKLTKDISRVALATSITLTPGTVTVRITDDTFLVHAITARAARGLPGEMERRIGRIFEEDS